jgi:hypothetical protein
MILPGYGMPIEFAMQLLAKYVYERKGIVIHPIPPRNESETDSFEKMFTIVCMYYNIQF